MRNLGSGGSLLTIEKTCYRDCSASTNVCQFQIAGGEVFGDATVAAAMIDRLVHRAEVVSLMATATGCRTVTSGGCLATTTLEAHKAVNSQLAKRGSDLGCR
jgi:hypothetical protein